MVRCEGARGLKGPRRWPEAPETRDGNVDIENIVVLVSQQMYSCNMDKRHDQVWRVAGALHACGDTWKRVARERATTR